MITVRENVSVIELGGKNRCKNCAPGFYGSDCAPAGSGGGSSHFLFFAVLFAGGAYYYGKSNRYF